MEEEVDIQIPVVAAEEQEARVVIREEIHNMKETEVVVVAITVLEAEVEKQKITNQKHILPQLAKSIMIRKKRNLS